MITYSIIQLSQLEGATRFDAEFYEPEYLNFAKQLLKIGEIPLGKITFITDGQHGYHKVDPTSEIRHITAKNVLHWLVNDDGCDRLSTETHKANKRSMLEVGDLLISTAGTIGAVGIVQDDILPANIDQDVARIHILNQNELNPNFLLAFLNSKYGQFQLKRETTGQIQTHVSLDKLKNSIFVPIPNWQTLVANLVKEALANLKNSKFLFKQAENLLLEELGLQDFQLDDSLFFSVNLSDTNSAHRFDADYFQPKYDKLISKLGNNLQLLKNIGRRKKFTVKINKDIHYRYIEISDINNSTGEAKYNNIKGNELPANAKMQIEGGELIISKVRPTRGAIAIIPEDWHNNYVASSAFSIFQVQSPTREYLQVILRSIVGRLQLVKPTTGTSYPTVTDQDIENLIIPILPLATQQKIADLVKKSHDSRKKSKELLETAKRKVEKMIEN
ncbi:restriction endonuclease subunit S [Patescibacteria group bacterium]|nr:restriction endonuclease subunit S [Patescibacteria group bacterium]MBU4017470.1 restriction endonuclease subunit S [Patescibacteria group bacterium]